ncbi:MAG: HD domain-containing phosphohydrolase [Paraclostridium sordellii]
MYKNTKIIVTTTVIILLSPLVFLFLNSKTEIYLTKEEKQWIKEHKDKEIVAESVPKNRIYYTNKNGKTFGVFKDVQEYINQLYGINIVMKNNVKEPDILWSVEVDDINPKNYIKTKQYDFDTLKIYTPKEISSLADIKNRKIAIHKSFNKTQQTYNKYMNFIEVDDINDIKKLYENGEVFGFILSSSDLKYLDISQNKAVYSKNISKELKLQILAYVKEDKILKGLIDKALSSIKPRKMNEIKIKNQLEYIKVNLDLSEDEKQWLKNNREIPIKINYKFRPYYYENMLHGKVGILNEYINRIEYILGVKFIESKNQKPEIYFGTNKLDKEANNLEIMRPYNSYKLCIYSKKETVIDNINQLEGYRIGVIKNLDEKYIYSKVLSSKVKKYNSYNDMVSALESNEIDYLLGDAIIMQYYIKDNDIIKQIFDVGVIDEIFYEYTGVNKNNKILADIMKKVDNNINTDVLLKCNKNNVSNMDDIDYSFIMKVVHIFLIMIIISSIYIIILRKEIKSKLKLQKNLKQAVSNNKKLVMSLVETLEDVNYLNDSDTGSHIHRISKYCEIIARRITDDENFIREITYFSSLHDIGKVAIPDSILKKPGKLTDEEMEIMKTHVTKGYEIIKKNNLSDIANNIILYHHERYDGRGYVKGLKGKEIPIEARIVAIADVYDALRMDRCYKKGFAHLKAMEIIISEKGNHFDPKLVDILVDVNEEIDKIFSENN